MMRKAMIAITATMASNVTIFMPWIYFSASVISMAVPSWLRGLPLA